MKDILKDLLSKHKNEKQTGIYRDLEKLIKSEEYKDFLLLEEKHKLLFNNPQIAYQSLDKNGIILNVNSSWLKILGYTKKQVVGKPFINFLNPDFIEYFSFQFKKFQKDGKLSNSVFQLRNKNGSFISASYERCAILNTDGKFQSAYCSFRDITHEIKILDDLKESQENYKKLIRSQGEGIGITNPFEIFTFSNPAADKIFGLKKGGLIGKSLNDFLSLSEQANIKKETQKRIKGKKSGYELEITDFNGIKKQLLVTVTPNRDKKGNFIGTFGIFRDITHRKEIENALIESEAKFRAITSSAQDAIILINEKAQVTFWNASATKMFQYTYHEVINKDIHNLIAPEVYRNLYTKGFEHFIKTGKGNAINNVRELIGKRKDGIEIPIELSLSALKIDNKWHSVSIIRDISERKDAENIIAQSEERFRAIFEMNEDLIGIADVDTATFFKVNPSFSKTLGYSEDEIISQPFLDLIHPDDVNKTKKVIETELKKGKKIIHFTNRYRCKNGDYRILEWKSFPDITKRIIYAVAHDITQQKEYERRLKESEERFKMLSEVGFEAIVIHKNGIMQDCNHTFSKVSGYSREDAINQSLFKIIPERYHAIVIENIKKQTAKPYEISIRKKDNTEIPVEFESANFIFNNETLRVAAVRDITERREVQRRILENEKKFRIYIETSPIAILIANKQGKYIFVNPAASKLLGYSKEELLNMSIPDIHFKEDNLTIELNFQRNNSEGVLSNYETRFKAKSGDVIYAILESIKLSENEFIAFCVNITERKKYEAKLNELNATKDKFFSIIAHDLRGPMNNLIGFSELLSIKHQSYSKEKLSHIINILNSSAKQTFALLENLLIWSKSQRNKLSYTPEEFICNELISEVIDEMQHYAISKDITIESNKGHNKLSMLVDKNMFKTIFRNLISNAVKFTYEGGRIAVGCSKIENNMATFFVSDTGVGIPIENLNQIFMIDQGISTPGTKDEVGTGLGLILCKEFVEKHGGKIWAENKSLIDKKGSTFYFTVPASL